MVCHRVAMRMQLDRNNRKERSDSVLKLNLYLCTHSLLYDRYAEIKMYYCDVAKDSNFCCIASVSRR